MVGVGASAGGLESLEQLFGEIPPDTGMAFIVIQHLSPDFRSLMDELIARHSEMPVVIAQDGMAVAANTIYLMPPRKEMIIRDRHLVLADKEPHTFTLPIDTFFRSLAADLGPQAVAIVLSGSGSDGSRGVVEVKQAGGLVLAESAASAKFDSMPLSAAATGSVDGVHAPQDLGRILCGLPPSARPELALLSDDPSTDSLLRLLRDQFGIDFSLYKTSTVGRRIQRRVDLNRFASLQDYVDQLRSDPQELNALYQDLLIGVTQFFRDPDAFEVLEREVIPKLLEKANVADGLRVWVAGCATGEEPYSIAILFAEAIERLGRHVPIKIIASDVHQASLDIASTGLYSDEQLMHVSPSRLDRFFLRRSAGYQIVQELRQQIVFARHNVTKDAPFTKMHLISCRNMLIYLQPQPQQTALSLFHFGLAPSGVLFLGASETPGSLADEFTTINERWKVYRKRRDVKLLSQIRLPSPSGSQPRTITASVMPRAQLPEPNLLSTYDQLLDHFMPPSLLIDEHRHLLDSFAGAERLLHVRKRRPTNNALELLQGELRSIVAGAVQRVFKEGQTVAYSGVRLPGPDGEGRCTLTAQPFFHQRTGARHVLVSFRDLTSAEALSPQDPAPAHAEPVPTIPLAQASRERLETLETELAYTRETLQATIEELETSNEEMQATNEELVASNEELQSTNEELHSVNEELYTVNAEYQQRIAELKELNTDMAHLLERTSVGTVFLDRELKIRRFTTQIASVFRFRPSDIGRKISDFSHNIQRPALMDEIAQARTDGTVVEDEVRDAAGTSYFLRILPYRLLERNANGNGNGNGHHANGNGHHANGNGHHANGNGHHANGNGHHASGNGHGAHANGDRQLGTIEGVVLTLTDISALDKARARLAQLSAIVESTHDAIAAKALDGTITAWNMGAEQLYGYTAAEVIGRHASMLMQPGHEHECDDFVRRILAGEKIEHAMSQRVRKDGAPLVVSVSVAPVLDRDGEIAGISTIARDLSPLVAAQHELQERQHKIEELLRATEEGAQRREQFLAMLSHELRNPLAAVIAATALLKENPAALVRCHSVIERQSAHMKRLLDDLLDVSRITQGKFELRYDLLELRAAIEAALEAVSPLYAERGVRLRTSLTDEALPVSGDLNRLMQLVVNLLSNAANYSPRGSGVRLNVHREDDEALIAVEDHGVGIEATLQEKIFELFVQSDQRLDRSRGGLGVGLSLAKTIAERHGGRIEVHSEGPGRGSRFAVRLPLTDQGSRRAAVRHLHAAPARRRVLLVDDQDDARELLRMLLESRDHEVIDVADGPAAIEVLEREKLDVAFIDIGLPIMSGYEIAQRIRQRPDIQGVTLIALSGYGAPSDISAALAAGFDQHLIKPAELSKLEEILAAAKPSSPSGD